MAEGYIYIVDGSFALAAVDIDIRGHRIQKPHIKHMRLKQNFTLNPKDGTWSKNSQTLDSEISLFKLALVLHCDQIYTNYVFHDNFEKNTFGREVAVIAEDADEKDSEYWTSARPIPLTGDEAQVYVKKDSIAILYQRESYTDSLDQIYNKFEVYDVLQGYEYKNTHKNWNFRYDGILLGIRYNTVQGWNSTAELSFDSGKKNEAGYFSAGTHINYGLQEKRLRVKGTILYQPTNQNYLQISGGNSIDQFNSSDPITPLINSISTLFFEDNYMKLYDQTFANIGYVNYGFNGLIMAGSLKYSRRKPLLNTADWVLVNNNGGYTSNNPLELFNEHSAPFETHTLYKGSIVAAIRFGQDYITSKGRRLPTGNNSYPMLQFGYEKGFAASDSQYEYDLIVSKLTYDVDFKNKGKFGMALGAGKFFDAQGISFTDYKHFNGNQTHIGTSQEYLNVFNLLPYYSNSTNDAYTELHAEHNFKGFITNAVPGLRDLQWNLVLGYHNLAVPDARPYHEFTAGFDNVGFGILRLRVDYIRAYQGGFLTDGVVLGLKFLDALSK